MEVRERTARAGRIHAASEKVSGRSPRKALRAARDASPRQDGVAGGGVEVGVEVAVAEARVGAGAGAGVGAAIVSLSMSRPYF